MGGTDSEANYALACPRYKERKGAQINARDPKIGKATPLFHPRRNVWDKHFRWNSDHLRIEGRTAIGRATVSALGLDSLTRQQLRLIRRDRLADLFPFD